jgi:hypothetical protein
LNKDRTVVVVMMMVVPPPSPPPAPSNSSCVHFLSAQLKSGCNNVNILCYRQIPITFLQKIAA